MNPFDLRGPDFLLFYFFVAACVVAAVIVLRRALESSSQSKLDLADPYLIAYLRGGKNETLRVAVISLVDRGLLVADGTKLKRADNISRASVRKPLDQALLQKFSSSAEANTIFDDSSLESKCKPYNLELQRNRLMPDEATNRLRILLFSVAVLVLISIGGNKIIVALQRGRTNIGFLVLMMIGATIVVAILAFPRLTASGRAMLSDIQTLYADLKNRASSIRPGGATIEAAMLAAAFGVGALESSNFSYAQTLFPRAATSSASSYSGSTCGSSCGSSCGGGGCGGGCGGCGG